MSSSASPTAIIGLACLFPGAPTLNRFWRNVAAGVDAIRDVPPGRWDARFYDPESTAIDRFYCKRGGFVDDYASFDPLPFGIMPKIAAAAEPDQLLTLKMGYQALRDAGYEHKAFARERTGVIIGRGNYMSVGGLRLEQHVRLLPQILQTLQDLFPDLPEPALETVRSRLQQALSAYGPDVASSLIPNLVASRLANRLDLHGPAYTVDAACASSLIAVEQACAMLRNGETDLMLVGGVHLSHDLAFWATFCQLGALSRSGMVRPLSKDADGILAGEGVGMAILKRLPDALAAGDRIYAVIEGTGSSSDGRNTSLVAPSAGGQHIALERAWGRVSFDRDTIGLVEAHGTGTPTGDAVELETLRSFFGAHRGAGERPVVGSVKSMIGHAMPASGMASLIKTALAIHHGLLPPTLHCETPHPLLAETRFRAIGQTQPWDRQPGDRVAAVNAFGFGGINAHLVLRGLPRSVRLTAAIRTPAADAPSGLAPVLLLSADTPEALLARLDRGECDSVPKAGRCRLAVIAPDDNKLATARKAIASGRPWQGRQRIWFSPEGLIHSGGKLVFLFPGLVSSFRPQAADLGTYFGQALPPYCDEALDPLQALSKLVVGVLGLNRFLFERLVELGIKPDVYAGHSVGEWSAMLCSGMMDQGLSDCANESMSRASLKDSDLEVLSAGCSEQRLLQALEGLERVALSHDNCPHQVMACGPRASIDVLAERLRADSVLTQRLPFSFGFHSPLFEEHMAPFRAFFTEAKLAEPSRPVWSATTVQSYPAGLAEKRQLALDHMLQPVRFRALTDALYADGGRVFVQVGVGSLAGFINDTLSGRPHHAIVAHHEARNGLDQLQQLCAALWVEGADFDLRLLAPPPTVAAAADEVGEESLTPSTQRLALGVPLLRVPEPLEAKWRGRSAEPSAELAPAAANDPIGQLLRDTLAEITQSSRDVLALWQRHRAIRLVPESGPASMQRRVSCNVQRLLDVERTIPYVADHTFFSQPEGWPIMADRYPVVPMTMEVILVREAVEEALPDLKVVEVSQIQAYNWLAVATPVTVEISLQSLEDGTIEAEILGYFKARVTVAENYPPADEAAVPELVNPRTTEADAQALYRDGWMFHGPAYQGVTAFDGIGDNGIDGALRVSAGKGALLDNMGQLAGYWVMEQPSDCLAMPIGVERIRFFAPDLAPGEAAHAQVRIRRLDQHSCISDHLLRDASGNLRIAIKGWSTRRYQMDKAFSVTIRQVHKHSISQLIPPNVALFEDRYDTAIMRDYICRRYLAAPERDTYQSLSPRRRRQWLAGRVAAKDAIRAWLRRERGVASIYPHELIVDACESGAPRLHANLTQTVPSGLHLSISHKGSLAVAIVAEQPVGIDLEQIAERDESFLELVFNAKERALLAGPEAAAEYTRGWVVKEVAAKAAETGLGGHLRDFVIDARDGDCFRVNGHWVVTHVLRDCIVGWSFVPSLQTATPRTANGSK